MPHLSSTVDDWASFPHPRSYGDQRLQGQHNEQNGFEQYVARHHCSCTGAYVATALEGALIVGAGPSGLGIAACLSRLGVPYIMLERSDCIASLWRKHTYDRLHLHTAKHCCELPFMPFPTSYPNFLTCKHFMDYLEAYANTFGIKPHFNETVQHTVFDHQGQVWRVCAVGRTISGSENAVSCITHYTTKWLVVATGENAEAVLPPIPGVKEFSGRIIHSSQYKNGSDYSGLNVLVVGAGNSGMEIALDLANSGAKPSIVVRSPLHVLPREMFGTSTFSVAMSLCQLMPTKFVDYILVTYSQLKYGDMSAYGLRRPKVGPLELKDKMGKTPILDVGALRSIQSGHIKVKPAIERFYGSGVRFVDASTGSYDAVVFATGYRSIVPNWLKDDDNFFSERGLISRSWINSWKGKRGLYAAGLSGKGLLGARTDVQRIAEDITGAYRRAL